MKMLQKREFKRDFLVGKTTKDYATIILAVKDDKEFDYLHNQLEIDLSDLSKKNELTNSLRLLNQSSIGYITDITSDFEEYFNSQIRNSGFFGSVKTIKYLNPTTGLFDMRRCLVSTVLYEDGSAIIQDIIRKLGTSRVFIFRDYSMKNYEIKETINVDLLKIIDYVR